jgi:hypothetical protein
MADDSKTPLDQLLDVALFAPVGLALTVKDELPNLIQKGRQRVTSQVTVARMIGQFAVTQGQKEAEKAASRLAARLNPPPAPVPAGPPAVASEPFVEAAAGGAAVPRTNGHGPTSDDHLAIPGYDTLSASQVVQRLAGLSSAELEAVRQYEESHRGRRTILSKVSQLESERH